jgi:hypothetical protein
MEEIEQDELLKDPTAGLTTGIDAPTITAEPLVKQQAPEVEDDTDFFDIAGDVALAPFRGVEGMLNGVYNLADMALFDVLPDLDTRFLGTSKTTAGSLVEGISQFASGFIPIFGQLGRVGVLAKAGTVTKGVVAGAVTDFAAFNGQEERLSNLIQQYPELQNPVTEYLAHDADETEVEGRIKNVLEGLILEGAIGGSVALFLKSLKALKAGKKVRDVEGGGADDVNKATADMLEGEDLLTDVSAVKKVEPEVKELKDVEKLPEPIKPAPQTTQSKIETDPEWKEWTDAVMRGEKPTTPRMEVTDDIDSAYTILTDKYKKNPELLAKFKDKPIDFLDDDLNRIMAMAPKVIKDQQEIRLANEVYKDILKGSTEKLMKSVKEFEATESLQAEASLRNQLSEVIEVYDYYRQMGKEVAVTLAMRRSKKPISRKVGLETSGMENTTLVKEFLNSQSGGMSPKKAVDLIKEMYDPNNPEATISKVLGLAKKTQGKSLLDVTSEYWINSLLSGPRTQAVNFLGNALTQLLGTAEMTAGAVLTGNIPLAKAALASWADWSLWSESIGASFKTLVTGREVLDVGSRTLEAQTQALGKSIDFDPLGKGSKSIDRNAINTLGTVVNLPARGLLTGDELFKQLAFRRAARLKAGMEAINAGITDSKGITKYVEDKLNKIVALNGQAMSQEALIREGTKQADELGLVGVAFAEKRVAHIKKYVDDNFDEDASNLAAYALEEAKYFTHTRELEEGSLGKQIQNITKNYAFARFVLPFVRTPSNLLSFALERTPLSASFKIPGTNKRLNVPGLRSEAEALQKGLASKDPVIKAAAQGKVVTSFATAGLFYEMVFNNNNTLPLITGGGPKDERQKKILEETGWRPYSIKIDGTYYSYQRLDPIATLLGVSADMSELMKENIEANEADLEHVGIAVATALSRNVANKSYLAGIQLWADALKDPERFGERLGRNYSSSFVPNVLSQMQDYDKQSMREVRSIADAVLKKLPNGRDMLDPKRNILGEEKIIDYGSFGFINPVAYSAEKEDPVLQEMAELKYAFRQPSAKLLNGNVDLLGFVNNKGQTAHDRRLELLQEITIGGRTLRQSLNKLIKSSKYKKLPGYSPEVGLDSPRVRELTNVLRRYRKLAKMQMLKEFPEASAHINKTTRALALNRKGVNREDVLELLAQ